MMTSRRFTPTANELAAILDGRQTQFRRPLKPQPGASWRLATNVSEALDALEAAAETRPVKSPWGGVGSELWVQERWLIDCPHGPNRACDNPDHIYYREGEPAPDSFPMPWRPAITMPRWASRLTLRVTGVRVERIQEITERDAKACGITSYMHNYSAAGGCGSSNPGAIYVAFPEKDGGFPRALQAFEARWDAVYAKLPFSSNPWAWVVDFEVI